MFPLIFEAIALTFAPQSLVSPMGGLTIVLNQIAAPLLLHEHVSTSDWHAIAVLFSGIVVSTGIFLFPSDI